MSELTLLVSEASEVVGIHPNTLRRLEAKGLIRPARDYNGWRRYEVRDLLELKEKLQPKRKD
jgi:DNA-binding transcriptional MerR regulator